jgi:hypothetical protein
MAPIQSLQLNLELSFFGGKFTPFKIEIWLC